MHVFSSLAVVAFVLTSAIAQDPVKIDPKHYKVEFENARVRVLRIKYDPHEKSSMHEHPDGVAIFLTADQSTDTLPDGTTHSSNWKAGEATWTSAGKHAPDNTSDKPLELILVELKGGTGAGSEISNEDKNSEAAKLLALTNEWTDAINSRNRQKLDSL